MYLVGELFTQKRLEPVLSVFVGLQVQVQADDRKGARLEVGETVEPRGKLFKLWHAASLRKPHAYGLIFS